MSKGFPNVLYKVTTFINRILIDVQVVAIIASALVVTLDVLMRLILSKPITGASEYVGYIMILASYFGLGVCAQERSHLKVDLIVQMLSERAQVVIELINSVLVAAVGTIMLVASVNQGFINLELGTTGTFSGVYNWPFYMLMGLGYLPVVLACICNFIEDIGRFRAASSKKKLQAKGDEA